MQKEIEEIASDYLDLDTLETRNSDSLDIHELAVWQIRLALKMAYQAGYEAGAKEVQE